MAKDSKETVHRYLDGEPGQPDLSPDQVREISEHETIIGEARELYRATSAPDLTARITARLAAKNPANAGPDDYGLADSLHRVLSWLWAPRSMRVRPAYVALLAVVAVLPAVLFQTHDQGLGLTSTAEPRTSERIFVQFRLDAPDASEVQLAGSFTEWKPAYTLRETAPGVWSVLVPLKPGVHDYAFLVNGKWIIDPVAPVVNDGFGGANSRLLVLAPDTHSRL